MITAYFDESYSHPPAPRVYTIAGYIATDRQWGKFKKRWQRVLDRERLSPFSMKEFDNPHSKIYGNWSLERKVSFLKELHSIIKRHYMRSFSTGIVVSDYEELSDEEKYAFGNPHLCATINCIKHIGEWADKVNLKEPILYVFEKGTVDDKDLGSLFNVRMNEEERKYYRVQKLEFGTKEIQPLQAADILAVETRKEMCRRLDTEHSREVRKSIRNLNVPTLDEWYYMDRKEFDKVLSSPQWKAAFDAAKREGYFSEAI